MTDRPTSNGERMSTLKDQNTRHANRCRITANGVLLAEGTSVNVQEDGGLAPVRVIGSPLAQEHVYNAYSVSVSVARMVWREGSIEQFGLRKNLLNIPPFTLEGYEGDDLLFSVFECSLGNRNMSVPANSAIQANVSMQGIVLDFDDPDFYAETVSDFNVSGSA